MRNRIAELTGHTRGTSVLARVYIKAATLPIRKADVERLKFPFTNALAPVPADRFDRYLRAVAAKIARKQRSTS